MAKKNENTSMPIDDKKDSDLIENDSKVEILDDNKKDIAVSPKTDIANKKRKLSKKNKIIIILLVIGVIIISMLLGMSAAGYFTKPKAVAQGIVVSKTKNESKLLTSYDDYTKLMNEYGTNEFTLLTNNSFEKNDYIVDFVKYKDNLEIKNINLEINDDGVKIIYDVNKEIKNSSKYLMYFIPIEKSTLNDLKVTSQVFNEK